jgi:hypothetical protein
MLSVMIWSVAFSYCYVSVIMLSGVMLNVAAPHSTRKAC